MNALSSMVNPYQRQLVVHRLWLAHSTCTSHLELLRSVHQLRRCLRQCKMYKLRWF